MVLWTNSIDLGTSIVSLYFQHYGYISSNTGLPRIAVLYISISVSLNVILTLMIVVRLVLHGRNIRAATGSAVGVSGLYKVVSTMLIESCALFAVSSLLVVGTLAAAGNYVHVGKIVLTGDYLVNTFFPILAETQVCAFPRPQSPDQLPDVSVDRTGNRFTTHHSKGREPERADGPRYHHWMRQFVQRRESRGANE